MMNQLFPRVAIALAMVLPQLASAQVFRVDPQEKRDNNGPVSRVMGGAALVYSRPTGDFGDYVTQAFGLDGNARLKIDNRGIFSLGVDGGWAQYGSETSRVPLSGTVGRILVDVTTSNNIVFLGAGPQLTAPAGPVRPYVNGNVGLSYFFTRSSVEGSSNTNNTSFAETTNFDDFVFATTGGAGVLIPFGRSGEAGLDIGVRYHNTGDTKYLREGSIIDRPGNTPLINPIRSDTKMWSFRVGFVAGLR